MESIFDLVQGFQSTISSQSLAPVTQRHLADLRDCFDDAEAYKVALAEGNPLIYSVSSFEGGSGEGDLHYGLGILQPGRVGNEYYFTKGHFHEWRPAAEIYIGLSGTGGLLLEEEGGKNSRFVAFGAGMIVYVPGSTAHRSVNTGDVPLVYIGAYSAAAGHDYAAIAERNFSQIVVAGDQSPLVLEREYSH